MRALPSLLKTALLCLFVTFTLDATLREAAAQDAGRRSTLTDLGGTNPLQQLRQRMAPSTTAVPLEGAVDEATYLVGPGDLFDISIGGGVPILATLPVSADGYLLLPEAGGVRVAGLTLAEAKARALEALRTRFRNVRTEMSLAQPRQFYVHVSGAVAVPGRYLATPVARVASVLEMAYADTTQAPVTNLSYRPSLRNVLLIRRDGTERSLDLLRYFATGDTDHNPYLHDGDVLSVPAYDPQREALFVDGAVAFPGRYDYRPGDTVADVLALAGGARLSRNARAVRLTRTGPGGTPGTTTYTLADLTGTPVTLEPRDNLFVVGDQTLRGAAAVEGRVVYPGTYPIDPGTTTLRQLVEMAGGLHDDALLRGAYLERYALPQRTPQLRQQQHRFEGGAHRLTTLPVDTTAILQNMRLADLDFMSRAYFAQELRLQNRVSVDVAAALGPDGAPVMLQDGDRLVIPHDTRSVYVFGQVARPGFVTLAPGRAGDYYIAAAGGASGLAAEAYLIEAGTGRYRPLQGAAIHSGDLIFLDRANDIADTAELQRLLLGESQARADARIRTTQVVLSLVSTVGFLISTYLSLRK